MGKTLLDTVIHLDEKAKFFEKATTMAKSQFHETDFKLDQIREDARLQEMELIAERERLRDIRRDVDFADEQMDHRIVRQERTWAKSLNEQEEKVEILRLAQTKTNAEKEKLLKALDRKREAHRIQTEAWNRELQAVMREQNISAMIQESYIKEIERVKR